MKNKLYRVVLENDKWEATTKIKRKEGIKRNKKTIKNKN